jgi:hypothetical protein
MLTKADIQKEYITGLINPAYTIEKHLKAFDLTKGGYVPFKLFPRQKEIISCYEKVRNNIVTKPRQTGVSTTTQAYLACKAAYTDPNKPEVIIVIANKFASAKKFLAGIRMFLSHMPRYVWGEFYDERKKVEPYIDGKGAAESITLLNGTKIIALATSPDALRGYTPTYLVIDEAAYVETQARELYNASMAALSTGGKMIIISTPNGKDELYYKTYINAKSGENGFNIIHLKWYEDPRYNKGLEWHKEDDLGKVEIVKEIDYTFASFEKMEKAGYKPIAPWYKTMCSMLNNDKLAIARELDVKFEGSAGTVVEQEWIEYHERVNVREPIEKHEQEDRLWVYEHPVEGHEYIMGVDVSSGNSDDFSAVVVIDTTTGDQVLEYKGKIRPEYLAEIVFKWGNTYSALTIVDTTGGYGDNCILKLQEFGYKYLYYSKGNNPEFMKKKPQYGVNENKLVAGYKISSKRPQIIGKLTGVIEENDFKIKSSRFVAELETFVWVNGRPDHTPGFNDDLIMAAALAFWVLETEFKSLEKAKAQTKSILSVLGNGGNKSPREKSNLNSSYSGGFTTPSHVKSNKITSSQDPTGEHSWLFM